MQSQLNRTATPLPEDSSDTDNTGHSVAHSEHTVQSGEQDLVDYLVHTPEFFERHADLLSQVRLSDPNSGRAVSLQERQLDVLRSREKQLQADLDALVRMARSNDQIASRLTAFSQALLGVRQAQDMPDSVVNGLRSIFDVPQVALRLWRVNDSVDRRFTDGADADTRRMTDGLDEPYCGLKGDIAQARWLDDDGRSARSVALLPLRSRPDRSAFGLIVLGSTDADRFQTGMGTEFLERIAQTAGTAMLRLVRDDQQ